MINNLTGRNRHTRRLCLITVNSIASQLVKNGIYKTINRESAKLVVGEVSQLEGSNAARKMYLWRFFSKRIG